MKTYKEAIEQIIRDTDQTIENGKHLINHTELTITAMNQTLSTINECNQTKLEAIKLLSTHPSGTIDS